MPRLHRYIAALAASMALAAPSPAASQQINGFVRDSTSGAPVPGAVVTLQDSLSEILARVLADEFGRYHMREHAMGYKLHVVRLGFRARDLDIPRTGEAVVKMDVNMLPIPTYLEPVRVIAKACAARPDLGAALGLLEQARAGLLATVVATRSNSASVVRYAYQRQMDGTSDRILRQTVRTDSADEAHSSFSAVHDAQAFVRRGFMESDEENGDVETFFAPDAEVILDDAFASGYCFNIAHADRAHRGQIGLEFKAADRRKGRVDVTGTLWVDTTVRAVREIEFRYTGLPRAIQRHDPGGSISFRPMPNGVAMIDRWNLDLVGAHSDSVERRRQFRPYVAYFRTQRGGELAHASWGGSVAWDADLGRVHGYTVNSSGQPVTGIALHLPGTPYRAVTDASGHFEIRDLVPGPYTVVVDDARLWQLRIPIPTGVNFIATRGETTEPRVTVFTAEQAVIDRCIGDGHYSVGDTTLLIARVVTSDGRSVQDAEFSVSELAGSVDMGSASWTTVRDGGRTGRDGVLQVCSKLFHPGATVRVSVWRDDSVLADVAYRVQRQLTVLPIIVDSLAHPLPPR